MGKQILLENAYQSWSQAIYYCNRLLNGFSTLNNQKHFVSALHNAVELFLKQIMLDKNDYRVVCSKNQEANGSPLKQYFSATDLNVYFKNLNPQMQKKFHSIEFSKLVEKHKEVLREYFTCSKSKSKFSTELKLLNELRNAETHFYINPEIFLTEVAFISLHNFMVDFMNALETYGLLPFIGEPCNEYRHLVFDNNKLTSFSYKTAIKNSNITHILRKKLNGAVVPYDYQDESYAFACHIATNHSLSSIPFNDIWECIDILMHFKLIDFTEETQEIPIEINGCKNRENVTYTVSFNL